MGTEEAILYSYDLATLPSILPAFASKKDLIICDEVGGSCGLEPAGALGPQDLSIRLALLMLGLAAIPGAPAEGTRAPCNCRLQHASSQSPLKK